MTFGNLAALRARTPGDVIRFKVGDATIHRVVEMECGFTPILEFFPTLTKERLEENRSWMQPAALDADDNLVLCFQSYVLQIGGKNILVDSCVGNDKSREARPLWNKKKDWAFQNGLAAAGLTFNDIDFVMCSHLHGDHFGGLPFFLLDAQLVSRRTQPLVIAGPPGLTERLNIIREAMFAGSTSIEPK